MYKSEFDKQIQANKLSKAYFFYGQSHFLIDYYASFVADIHGQKDDIEKIYYDDYNFKYAKDKLLQSSLFSSNNILVIKTEKKLSKTELTSLVEACNANPDSILIYCLKSDDGKALESVFSSKANGVSVRFFAPKEYEAIKILEVEAAKLNLIITSSALNHLYFMHRQNLSLAANDLNKLQILDDEINVKDIDTHCFGIGEVNIDDFLQALFSAKDIEDDLRNILEEGVNEIYLLSQATSFLQQLFMIASYIRLYGNANSKEILGYSPPKEIWEKRVKVATFLASRHGKFTELFELLLNLELELKSGKVADTIAVFEASLRKLSALLR